MQNSGDQGNVAPAIQQAVTPAAQPSTYGAPAGMAPPNSVPRPAFAQAPADAALALRITKLAEYTARNGPAFEAQVRAKQAGSQEYTFLFGGEGTAFYRWCLFCMQRHLPHTLPLPDNWVDSMAGAPQPGPGLGTAPERTGGAAAPPQQHAQPMMQPPIAMLAHSQAPMQSGPAMQGQPPGFPPVHLQQQSAPAMAMPNAGPPGPQPSAPGAINPEVASGFAQVLHVLQGSQESIKSSSSWFLACRTQASGMANMMLHRVQQIPDFAAQLHVLYLINDILFATHAELPPQEPDVAAVFQPMLPDFFVAAYRTAARSQEAFSQLTGLLDLWSSRGIFNVATSATVRARMLDVGAPATVPIPAPPIAQQAAPPPQFPPDAGPRHGWGPPVGAMHMGGAPPPGVGLPPQPHPTMGPPSGPAGGMPWRGPAGAGGPPHMGPLPGMLHAPMGPPAGTPAPAIVPEKEPYNLLSFPAGLIPKLARAHLRRAPGNPLSTSCTCSAACAMKQHPDGSRGHRSVAGTARLPPHSVL